MLRQIFFVCEETWGAFETFNGDLFFSWDPHKSFTILFWFLITLSELVVE